MTPSALNAADLQRIRDSAGWRLHRTEAFETADGPVIVKGQRPGRTAGHRILNLLARASGARVLQAAPMHGGQAAQDVEVRRLQALAKAGVPVPDVLHVEPGFFVMELLPGVNLAQKLDGRPADAPAWWRRGLEAIRHVHACGEYLSQAHARNFIVTPRGLAAIDFEDDPLEVMTLEEAQARDWLVYLQSTLWMLPSHRAGMLATWDQFAPAGSGLWRDLLVQATSRLGWMRHLPSARRPWGRDVVSAQAAAAFLYEWAHPRRPH